MYLSVILMFVYAVGLETLRVHGPSDTLVAHLRGPVLLPCFIEGSLPLENLQVEWKKLDTDSLVSLFQQGKSRPDLQIQVFRDRADFFPDEVPKGNFSILLKNVVKDDVGVYRCQVNTTQDTGQVIMEMKEIEQFVVKGADHAVFAHEGDDVILNCSVDSHVPVSEIEEVTWKKTDGDEDILVLLYQNSEIFPDSSHESYQGRVDFFSSEISKGNFSLQLKELTMKDNGEFTCEVHTSDMSARTTVVLHGVGFSTLSVLILVFCLIALLLAVGFCGPVFNLLRKKVVTKKAMKIHISLILCPNICMIIAFCLWSTEGFLLEVITCLTVSIIRPIMLIKTSSYLNRFPKFFQKAVKVLAFPLYHLSLTMGACSPFFIMRIQTPVEIYYTVLTVLAVLFGISAVVLAVYGLRMHLTLFLEVLTLTLLALKLTRYAALEYGYEIVAVLPALIVGILIVLSLQRHLFLGKPFECVHITLSSLMMFAFTCNEIFFYILFTFLLQKLLIGLTNLFVVVLLLCAWLAVICLVRFHRAHRQRSCSHWRKIGCKFILHCYCFIFNHCIWHNVPLLYIHPLKKSSGDGQVDGRGHMLHGGDCSRLGASTIAWILLTARSVQFWSSYRSSSPQGCPLRPSRFTCPPSRLMAPRLRGSRWVGTRW